MDTETLDYLFTISEAAIQKNWKAALDRLTPALRKGFIFDNMAVYTGDAHKLSLEVVYARAVGRGRRAEADAAWGENLANQVLSSGEIILETPSTGQSDDRVETPHLLGVPLHFLGGSGALVFIRFGGPDFTPEHFRLAAFVAGLVSSIFERRILMDLNSRLETAQQLAQLQDDFIATISHDLHTPLGFIKGYATSLLRQDTTWDDETRREFLTIIDEESDHLMALIEKMLDSARLRSGMLTMDFQPVRLDAIIRDVVLRVCTRHKGVKIEVDLEGSPLIQADAIRLAQVFENLLENAVKYAPGAQITITLRNLDGSLRAVVADQGPGISEEHLPFIFERFFRVPGQPGTYGTGLGLYICRQIIQAHGGQITVATAPGKGAAFSIQLPVHNPQAAQPPRGG